VLLAFREHPRKVGKIVELHLAADESREAARGCASFGRFDKKLDTLRGEARGLDPVEGCRVAALLKMTKDRLPHVEKLAALFFEQRGDKAGCVDAVGMLVADHQAKALPRRETGGDLG
jgi:hypothetical protein